MPDEAEIIVGISPEMEEAAAQRARDRARNARWDLNVLISLFAVLILVTILSTTAKAGLEIVAPVAAIGLAMVWVVGWWRGRQLYQRFYDEELSRIEQELKRVVKATAEKTAEEAIDEKIQKALRERWK